MSVRSTALAFACALSVPVFAVRGETLQPTAQELRAFTNEYDLSSRPDLVTSWMRLSVVLGDAESLKQFETDLSNDDYRKLSDLRGRLVASDMENNKLFARMFEQLCTTIRDLDSRTVGRRIVEIDRTIAEQRDLRLRELLAELSASGAKTLMEQANKAAVRVRGSYTDIEAMTQKFPDYVKEQYSQRCIAFGYIK